MFSKSKSLTHHNTSRFRDVLPYVLNRTFQRSATTLSTIWGRLLAHWWNIQLGHGCVFTGVPILHKHPTAMVSIGDSCTFRSAQWSNSVGLNRRCFLSAGRDATIQIGNHCGLSATIIAASSRIEVGNHVLFGANCTICDTDRHPLDVDARRQNAPAQSLPIVIEDDVFLGMNVMVLKGCRIGRGTVVAAGSVVTRSLPQFVLAAGVPARVIRSLK